MSFSYNPANLATEDKDGVRFFLGDTDSLSPLLQDEEIVYALSQRGNRYGATGMCARALAAQFSRLVSTSADGVSAQDQVEVILADIQSGQLSEAPAPAIHLMRDDALLAQLNRVARRMVPPLLCIDRNAGAPVGAP